MSKEQLYKDALRDIAAMPLGGSRTDQGDIDNYELAVSLARAVLVKANRPGDQTP